MLEEMDRIRQLLSEAEVVLVGIGEECRAEKLLSLEESEIYKIFRERYGELAEIPEPYREWFRICMLHEYIESIDDESNLYSSSIGLFDGLYEYIKEKYYYVITTNTDGLLYQSRIEKSHTVAPCGYNDNLQCSDGCCTDVWSDEKYRKKTVKAIREGTLDLRHLYMPVCRHCGNLAAPNTIRTAKYVEAGYLPDWERYTRWLQRTLNKKLVILELGEGFRTPTVMRWPFEKIVYLNHRAHFIRVNETFPQTGEEIKEKAISLNMNSVDFLRELNR